jgi:hypothetical protein
MFTSKWNELKIRMGATRQNLLAQPSTQNVKKKLSEYQINQSEQKSLNWSMFRTLKV